MKFLLELLRWILQILVLVPMCVGIFTLLCLVTFFKWILGPDSESGY